MFPSDIAPVPLTPGSRSTPKLSPKPSPRLSPKRQALHERSPSQTNVPSSPTIRVVDDPNETKIYALSPFPSHPSQVLPPHKKPGYAFEDRGPSLARVSDENLIEALSQPKALVPQPLQPKKGNRNSHSTRSSYTDSRRGRSISGTESLFSPTSSRFSEGTYTTPPSTPGGADEEIKEELGTQLHVLIEEPSRSTIRAVPPSSPPEVHSKPSIASLASISSSETIEETTTIRRDEDQAGSSQASLPIVPPKSPDRLGSANSNNSNWLKEFSSSPNWHASRSIESRSQESIQSSHGSGRSQHRPRSSSSPATPQSVIRHPISSNDVRVQYPTLRSQSISSSWAQSSSPAPQLPLAPIQYPRIRAPSATPSVASSWAGSPSPDPQFPAAPPRAITKMTDRGGYRPAWSPQLSVINSESERGSRSWRESQFRDSSSQSQRLSQFRDSTSIAEASRPTWSPVRPKSFTLHNNATPRSYDGTPVPMPEPLFSPQISYPEGRESDEQEDIVHELQAPPLRHKKSGMRHSDSSRPNSSRPESVQSEAPSERSSFSGIGPSMPSWAKRYYSLGERANVMFFASNSQLSLSRSNSRLTTSHSNRSFNYLHPNGTPPSSGQHTSDSQRSGHSGSPQSDTFPFSFSIFHPRKRPSEVPQKSEKRGKRPMRPANPEPPTTEPYFMSSMESIPENQSILPEGERYARGRPQRYVSEPFIPRLGRDRRSMYQTKTWTVPSLDETISPMFSRVNRQILCFVLGFIFPIAWMIAAALPLPEKPLIIPATMQQANQQDIERAVATAVDPMEYKRYNKARWWRNLNRIMSAVGLLIIGAVIALAIVSSLGK